MKLSVPRLRLIVLSVVILLAALSVQAADSGQTSHHTLQSVAIFNQHTPTANVISGGQPSKAQLAALKAAGLKTVINLRTPGEQDWDEAGFVKSLGMQYHAIPVDGPAGITEKNSDALAALLKSVDGNATLVHCASGNRVGALIALSATKQGKSVDDAINEGKRWGLTRLETVVRKQLSKSVQICCAKDEESKRGS